MTSSSSPANHLGRFASIVSTAVRSLSTTAKVSKPAASQPISSPPAPENKLIAFTAANRIYELGRQDGGRPSSRTARAHDRTGYGYEIPGGAAVRNRIIARLRYVPDA